MKKPTLKTALKTSRGIKATPEFRKNRMIPPRRLSSFPFGRRRYFPVASIAGMILSAWRNSPRQNEKKDGLPEKYSRFYYQVFLIQRRKKLVDA
ncbi:MULTISPECIES: hypothetical protein [Akkermansia]|uniref:hypothetical protein n=1 Tax=Akkermansia TaxID=239934 RepID=UPI001BFFAA79|nr:MULTISPECIES: hypothetical protein [Akkermansia]MBT8796140.1 hypothetical protein [Akkermansia muciniphila]MBS7152497.1 hypothetical protein [Akkermansia sp.]MBT9563180.1 hypothetical protein [Candidatus Akkermansia timonensis]MBT9565772.1 hypothetical protein [Akkermansia muciniphila]MBT9601431.1 hypothetical protein [Akkermansia muciniphila]